MDDAITRWINGGAGRSAVLDAVVVSIAIAGVPIMVLAVVALWWGPRHHRIHLRHIAIGLPWPLLVAWRSISSSCCSFIGHAPMTPLSATSS